MGIDDGSRGGISLRLMNDLDGFLLIRFVSSIFHTQIVSSIFLENEKKLNENSSMMDKMRWLINYFDSICHNCYKSQRLCCFVLWLKPFYFI